MSPSFQARVTEMYGMTNDSNAYRPWLGVAAATIIVLSGCTSALRDRSADAQEGVPTSQSAGRSDYVSDQAGSMAEEDARRAEPAKGRRERKRPAPIHRERRSPVDQPRIR